MSTNGVPNISDKQRDQLQRKIDARARMSKWEIRAYYRLSRDLYISWMKAIDNVDTLIPGWAGRRKDFTPREVGIIVDNFSGE